MPILTAAGRWILLIIATLAMMSCNRGSPSYEHIKDLPESQWESYAATLPIEQRLDLHKEIMDRSGHNPVMTIRFAFSSDPDAAYRAIVRRLKTGDDSRYYSTILYAIDGSEGFEICAQADRKIVQSYL